MKTIGFAMLALAGAMATPQDKAGAAPGNIEAASDARTGNAEDKAREIMSAFDPERMFSEAGYAQRNREAIEVLRPLVRDERLLQGIDLLRQLSLLAEGRNEESLKLSKEMVSLYPGVAHIYSTGLWAAMHSRRAAEGVGLLESAARDVKDPEQVAGLRETLSNELVFGLFRPLAENKDDAARLRMAEALLVLGGDDRSSVPWLDGVRSIALEGRLAAGKIREARALLGTIVEPREVIRLVGARRFDPLFDQSLDRRQAVEAAIAAWDKATADRLATAPDDLAAILDRAQHFRSLGREEDALQLLLPHTADIAAVEKAGERAFWIVNEAAYALGGLGRHDEAIRLMERLQTLPIEKYPELISMAINHGIILSDAGRFREAVAWEKKLDAMTERAASDYGYMWIWSTIACAESMEGNSEAAAPWLAKLAASSEKNEAARMRALICADRMDEAEKLLLARLAGPESDQLLTALHLYEIGGPAGSRQKLLAERLEALLERPAVKAALDKVGRRLALPLSKIYWGDY